ncbi:hypothetical protein [Sediminibacillus albus]|uniref:Uncharacterized protein n=1 Tax=Sediminibacillus albus TaxID=407036 RepID=A0A1G8WQJ8_9BACI|nr:hypothetical protein [Sediminibacillus albus]SDJ79900.1 hypothetical protein SAMN05216243_0909 [Sediminibacillus albus]
MFIEIKSMLPRKIIAAVIAGSLFAVLFGLIRPNPFGSIASLSEYFSAFLITTPVYLLYSFPVIFIYGSSTSIISDLLSRRIARKWFVNKEVFISGILHLLFGLILLWISLLAALIYFIVDRLLDRKETVYRWRMALKSLIIPPLLWIVFMLIISFIDFIENWQDYIVN